MEATPVPVPAPITKPSMVTDQEVNSLFLEFTTPTQYNEQDPISKKYYKHVNIIDGIKVNVVISYLSNNRFYFQIEAEDVMDDPEMFDADILYTSDDIEKFDNDTKMATFSENSVRKCLTLIEHCADTLKFVSHIGQFKTYSRKRYTPSEENMCGVCLDEETTYETGCCEKCLCLKCFQTLRSKKMTKCPYCRDDLRFLMINSLARFFE